MATVEEKKTSTRRIVKNAENRKVIRDKMTLQGIHLLLNANNNITKVIGALMEGQMYQTSMIQKGLQNLEVTTGKLIKKAKLSEVADENK